MTMRVRRTYVKPSFIKSVKLTAVTAAPATSAKVDEA